MSHPTFGSILPLTALALAVACGNGDSAGAGSTQPLIPPPPDVAAPPANAERSASGLAWLVLVPGDGETRPTYQDRVRVHYTGWRTDGTMFDSSVARGEPATFNAGTLIDGWVEGLLLMTEGERRRLWIPAELAYGERPQRRGVPAGMLVFDVELIEVIQSGR